MVFNRDFKGFHSVFGNHKVKKDSTVSFPQNNKGSDSRAWNVNYQVLKPAISNNLSPGGDSMIPGGNIYELMLKNIESNPFKVDPQQYNNEEELLTAIIDYAENFLNRSPTTIHHFSRYFKLMSRPDQPFPINWFKPSYEQFLLHMNWFKTHHIIIGIQEKDSMV